MNRESVGDSKLPIDHFASNNQRGFNEMQAAKYIGMSVSFLRKDRMNGVLRNRTPGPRWGKVGKRVVYLRDDLDLWLEKILVSKR